MKTRYRLSGGLAALLAAAIGLAACNGSGAPSATSSPTVASLATTTTTAGGITTSTGAGGSTTRTGGGTSSTTVPAGSPTQLLDEWATCMRSHGDPDQVDPTVDATKVIQITLGQEHGVARREWRVRLLPERGRDGARRWHASRVIERGDRTEVRPVHAGQRRPDLSRPDDRQ